MGIVKAKTITSKRKRGIMITIEVCPTCEGKGFHWVNNGPDDVEKEVCEICDGGGTIIVSEEDEDNEI